MALILQSQVRIPRAGARQQLMVDWFPNTDPTREGANNLSRKYVPCLHNMIWEELLYYRCSFCKSKQFTGVAINWKKYWRINTIDTL